MAVILRRWSGLILTLVLLVLGSSCATSRDGARAARPRPNILFIFTDDHAAHAISAYGSRINETPNIDRIAAAGVRFDNCFVTNAICGPSRACILTGKYSHKNGFYRNGNRFDGEQTTVSKLMQAAGYNTAMVGKWHLGTDPTGFDYWEILIGQGPYYNPTMIRNGERVRHTGYTTDIITDVALDWLDDRRDDDRPFFLMYQHKAPHRNWQPGPDHLTMYDDVDIPEPPTLFDDWAGRGSASRNQEMTIAEHLSPHDLKLTEQKALNAEQRVAWDAAYGPKNAAFEAAGLEGDDLVRWKYQRYIKDYLRCVASVDDNIGRVLDYLDESGLADNTVVIYCSDQGWYLGDHGWYDKRWMYEESLRMPLIVKWPGVAPRGVEQDAMASNVDFAATFLDMAGAADSIPDDMQGRSLVPLLEGGSPPDDWRDSFYYHYYEFPAVHSVAKHCGVRTERYKLIHFYQLDEWELYDLYRDPDEMRNVVAEPRYADVVQRLQRELARLQAELGETDPHAPVPGDPGFKKAG